jgi:pimeloyl-ACP methyl ester carboxylesterase
VIARAILLAFVFVAGACAGHHATPAKPEAAAQLPAFIDGPSGKLRVDDGGTGAVPVIFVHGLGGDRHVWDEALAHVRKDRRAIAIDLHGSGESALSPKDDYLIESFVADLAAVVAAGHFQRVVLVGHSYGAAIVADYAALNPERVAGIILVDPTADFTGLPPDQRDGFEKNFVEQRDEMFRGMLHGAGPDVPQRVSKTLDATPVPVFAGTLHGMFLYDPKPPLAKFTGPKIAIISEDMDQLPIALHHVVPGMVVRIMKDTSHWPQLDRPEEFAKLLDEFLPQLK